MAIHGGAPGVGPSAGYNGRRMALDVPRSELEQRTRAIASELLERLRAARPRPWQSAWYQERMLRQLMSDSHLKVQAFRFIDTLPVLSAPQELGAHLREYFTGGEVNGRREPGPSSGSALGGFLRGWTNWSHDDGARARVTGWAARRAALAMSGSFIAGSNIREAEAAIVRMRRKKLAFTIDLLGEAALSRREADHYHELYLDLLNELPRRAAAWREVPQIDRADGSPLPRVNVSVKVTSLHPGFDPIAPDPAKSRAKERLRPILRNAIAAGCHVQIDMEHYAVKELTLELVRELFIEPEFREYPNLGVVLQAYLVDAERDTAGLIDYARRRGTPLWIRLVKGAYWDSETVQARREHWPCPVWTQKWQSDACYERCAQMLIENQRHIHSAFASHNIRSLARALALRDLHDVPRSAFEVQMLYGMGDPIKQALAERGERCRVYTPYGDVLPGMAYLIRRLLENTANESFLRQGSDSGVPEEELLRDPEETGRLQPERPPDSPNWPCASLDEIQTRSFVNIADTDFSVQAHRDRMQEALRALRASFGRQMALRIGGEPVQTGKWLESRNPAQPGEVVARVAAADGRTVEQALAAAISAQADWAGLSARQRAQVLFEASARLHARRFEFAAQLVLEIGKPWRDADGEVSETIDYFNYYAHQAVELVRSASRHDEPGESNVYVYAPRGVTAAIGPWNFPLAIFGNLIAAPLVTGNAVVAKPASAAVGIGAMLVELLHESGVPAGVLNLVTGPGSEVGEMLVRHAEVQTVAFAGTKAVGLRIHRIAAEQPTARPGFRRTILEMGGKNAIIVDADADLDEAIQGVRGSALGFAGQKCTSVSRVIVVGSAYERFLERFTDAVRGMALGPPEDPACSIPPLASAEALAHVREWIAVGKREARCVLEADVPEELRASGGHYCGPVVLADVPHAARVAQEEIAGPIVCVMRAADMDEAVRIFNGTDYALVGGLYSRSPANIERCRVACVCGNFYINRRITGSKVDRQPFGGVKLSGQGARIGGPDYLKEFCEPRTITENTLRRGFAPSEDAAAGNRE